MKPIRILIIFCKLITTVNVRKTRPIFSNFKITNIFKYVIRTGKNFIFNINKTIL